MNGAGSHPNWTLYRLHPSHPIPQHTGTACGASDFFGRMAWNRMRPLRTGRSLRTRPVWLRSIAVLAERMPHCSRRAECRDVENGLRAGKRRTRTGQKAIVWPNSLRDGGTCHMKRPLAEHTCFALDTDRFVWHGHARPHGGLDR